MSITRKFRAIRTRIAVATPKHRCLLLFITCVSGCFIGLAESGAAEDAKEYRLRFEPTYRVNDRWRLTKSATQDLRRTTKPAEGDARSQVMESRIDFVGICTARAVSDAGAWTQLAVEVEKCVFSTRGKTQDILDSGAKLIVSVKDGKKSFAHEDGSEFPADKQRLFGRALGGSDAGSEVPLADVFALSTPRKVGAAWSCDRMLLVKALRGFASDLTADDVEGSARFQKVESGDGRTSLLWTASMRASTKNPPVAVRGGVPVLGSFEWKVEANVPADGRAGIWEEKITAELRQVFKGAPKSDEAKTTFEGKSIQTYSTKIEFLDPK